MTARETSACLTDEAIAAFVGGLLSSRERGAVEHHIVDCERCGELVAATASGTLRSGPTSGHRDDLHLAIGARVGRYEIVDFLGAGAMGTVYAAHDPALDRKIALKLIRAEVAGPALEARLSREAKTMARLSHPEVITVYDAGRDGDHLFIAMELVDGGTLREWLRETPRTWREILAVYMRAGNGLAQAHSVGIVHRDFKPDNVLVGHDGRVRVTDFGLARAEEVGASEAESGARNPRAAAASTVEASLTRTGALVGTPVYMAPEQLSGVAADVRSDVYGFCVSLYEALYGERPFSGTTITEIFEAKCAGNVRAVPPGSVIRPKLRRALLKGLRARPEDRYASMTELLRALDHGARVSRLPVVIVAVTLLFAGGAIVVGRATNRVSPSSPATSASASSFDACTSHRGCVDGHQGEPWVCRAADKTCVSVSSQDCVAKFEPNDLAADDTIWIGGMFPTQGPAAAAYGTMHVEGADLARKEIAHATRALEAPGSALHVPRIALVACDDSVDPMRAATHLADDLGVPAIIGFGSGQKLVDIAGALLIPRRVLTIASLTSSPFVTRVPQPTDLPRMVWRTTYSFDAVASAIAHLIPELLEPRLAPRTRATRVALVRVEQSMSQSFAETLYKQLAFNGKSALDNQNDYREVTMAAGASESAIARVAERVIQAAPNFVVLQGDEAMPSVVAAIEAGWKAPATRPTYVVASDSFEFYGSFLGRDADRRRRLFVVESVSSSSANALFVMRYNEAHEDKVTRTFNPSWTYDAFYTAAYAAFALGNQRVTGVAMASAIGRLVPPGAPIEVGPTQVFDGLKTLTSTGRIDLQGTASALDFDLKTGEAPTDFALLCAAIDANGNANGEGVESGAVYNASRSRVEGAIRCP